jgi:hypothetical protein
MGMKWFLYLVTTKERLLIEQYQLTAHLPLSFCGKIDPFMHNPPSEFNIPLGLSYGLVDCNTNFGTPLVSLPFLLLLTLVLLKFFRLFFMLRSLCPVTELRFGEVTILVGVAFKGHM